MTIAVGAIRAGYHAFVRSAFDLAQDFAEADAAGERRAFVQRLTTVDLLVLEDFGMSGSAPRPPKTCSKSSSGGMKRRLR